MIDLCPACPHPLDQHDPIGARYCAATTAEDVGRGCVCVGAVSPKAAPAPGFTETRKNYVR
jgi:hypothetical protein